MPNIVKGFYIGILCVISSQTWAQKLMNTNLDLNPGGVIHDIEYLQEVNKWIVVGDFNTINGSARSNLAFFDESFNLLATNIGTNGPIYAVDSYFISGGFGTTRIYIAGDFNLANGTTHLGAACYEWLGFGGGIFGVPYITTWDPDFDFQQCFDVTIWSNRVVYTGDFTEVNASTTQDPRIGIALFWANTGNDYPTIWEFNGTSFQHAWDVEGFGSYLYLGAHADQFLKINQIGTNAQNGPLNSDNAVCIADLDDSLIMVGYNHASGGGDGVQYLTVLRKSDLTEKTDHAYSYFHPTVQNMTGFDVYFEQLFGADQNGLKRFSLEDINLSFGIQPAETFPLVASSPPLNTNDVINNDLGWADNYRSNIDIEKNVLMASYSDLISASGQARTGVAFYCLPPKDPEFFTVFDSIICQWDTVEFALPASEFAEGYKWEFSDNTVDLDTSTTTIEPVFITANPAISIITQEQFISGILTVTPFSTCNGTVMAADTAFAKSVSIILGLDIQPNALAGPDTTLTCFFPTIDLIGNSDTANVSFSWKQLYDLNFIPGQTYAVSDSFEYVLQVENSIGCLNFDTILVDIDTIPPYFNPFSGSQDITCVDTVLPLYGTVYNTTDTLFWWVDLSTNDTITSNPAWISHVSSFMCYAQDTYNGCINNMNSPINTYLEIDVPNLYVQGYPSNALYAPIDTLNCYQPQLFLDAATSGTDVNYYWVTDTNSTISQGVTANITTDTTAFIYGLDTTNGCFSYQSILIDANFIIPEDTIFPFSNLNCSNDSILIAGESTWSNTFSQWSGNGIPITPDSVWVQNPGYYTFTTTWNLNGCSATDSIQVIADNSMDLISTPDTVACNLDGVVVSTSHIGNVAGISYLWNNGSTTQSANYTAGLNNFAAVEVFGSGGCYGQDTIFISIPPQPQINFQGFAPCASGGGSITASPISGWGPFQYSIDNGVNFQSSNTFNGLNEGTYTIIVKDSLDCNYDFNATIDQNSQSAQSDFLVTTNHEIYDTAVAINNSLQEVDSAFWTIPNSILILDEHNDSITFQLLDTGSYTLAYEAYFGSCVSIKTKNIQVFEVDSSNADYYNQFGIKDVLVYPNPNDGVFSVEIELYGKQDVSISLFDLIGNQYIDPVEYYYNTDQINSQINVTIPASNAGVYYLKIIGEFDSRTIEVTITP